MGKPPGIRDIADAVGASMMTVSRALRGVEGVSAARRAEILRVAAAIGYRGNKAAQALAVAHSNLVCVSVPTLFNDVFADILEGMRPVLDRAGLDLVLDVSGYDPAREAQWVERMLEWRPAGVILTGVDHAPGVAQSLRKAKIPTLEIWDVSDDPIDICVGVDHVAAGAALGAYLTSVGYRSLGYVGAAEGRDARSEKRLVGLAQAFQGQVRSASIEGASSFESGRDGVTRLLDAARPDVVVFLNDHMAFGGLCGLGAFGLSCPADIGLCGFNGLGLNAVLERPLTTMATPRREIGRIGAQHLVRRLNGAVCERVTYLGTELFLGSTTRR